MAFRLLGPHVEQVQGGLLERIVGWRPPVVVTTARSGAWSWVKEASPDTIIVMRPFEDDSRNPDFSRDDWNMLEVVDSLVKEALARVRGLTFDYLQLLNEPPITSVDAMGRLAKFDELCLNTLASYGRKGTIGNFSVGVPELEYWGAYHLALAAAKRLGGVLLIHEYDWPTMQQPDREWYCLRHEIFLPKIPADLRVPIIIGETGLDRGARDPGIVQGWNGHIEFDAYLDMLREYSARLEREPLILGAAIFCVGQYGKWWSYDLQAEHLDRLIPSAKPLYRQRRSPKVQRPGFTVEDISSSLPQLAPPPLRPVSGIRYVIVHHSATKATVTPRAIARYHVSGHKWPTIAYHYVIGPRGEIWKTLPDNVVGYHSGRSAINRESYGVCCLGNFVTGPAPDKQKAALEWLLTLLGKNVKAHSDIVATACPGALRKYSGFRGK